MAVVLKLIVHRLEPPILASLSLPMKFPDFPVHFRRNQENAVRMCNGLRNAA